MTYLGCKTTKTCKLFQSPTPGPCPAPCRHQGTRLAAPTAASTASSYPAAARAIARAPWRGQTLWKGTFHVRHPQWERGVLISCASVSVATDKGGTD